jgi:hypothetical protein
MPKVHLDTKDRHCGAITNVTGQSSFFIEGLKAAVEGDLNNHNNLGALVSQSPGTIFIEGKKMIVSMLDGSQPDQIGLITHVTNLPTPKGGASTFSAYGGSFGGGLGSIGGLLNVGENALLGGNVIGVVNKMVNQGGGQGLVVLSNLTGTTPTAGSTITGQTTGNSFTFSSFDTA